MVHPTIDFALLARATSETRSHKAGDVIFNLGDPGAEFLVVLEGEVGIRLGNRSLQTLERGEIFGEMALVDGEPRSATAVANTDCIVVPVSEKQFLFMVDEAPYFALSVMRVVVRRLRAANAAMPGS